MGNIGFLGVGKMGEAILGSLIHTAGLPPAQLVACDAAADRRAQIRRRYGVKVVADPPGSSFHVAEVTVSPPPKVSASLRS